MGGVPVPPYPAPDDQTLGLIIERAMECLESGEADVRGAVRYAALHGWLEGHLEGEACEADCLDDQRWQDLPYPDGE